jgi:hypothetical protein
MPLAQQSSDRQPRSRRTRFAIGLAVAAGVPVGVFLDACCNPPFGPVLLGWGVALVGAVVVTAGLCVLATDHDTIVGVGYAAGVAGGAITANVMRAGLETDLAGSLGSFAAVFGILAAVSLVGSVQCSMLKWEDRKARARARIEQGASPDRGGIT